MNYQTLRDDMRRLWHDHVAFTRMFVVERTAMPSPHPGVAATLTRLLKNQDDLGAAIARFYGQQVGAQLAKLLRQHITLAGKIIASALNGASIDADNRAWHQNASDIAKFFSGVVPYEAMNQEMQKHLDLLLEEVTKELAGDYEGSLRAYDASVNQILGMANRLADGIARSAVAKGRKG